MRGPAADPVPDIVVARPRILFVGINPGRRSGETGRHFAGPGNPFYRLLHAAGLTPELLDAPSSPRMADWGLALTNLCPRPTRTAAELAPAELDAGRAVLLKKIARWRPRVVALVGVTLYKQVFPRAEGPGGAGEKPERLAGAPVYVLPNPSGLNASYPGFADKRVWFERLRAFADGLAT